MSMRLPSPRVSAALHVSEYLSAVRCTSHRQLSPTQLPGELATLTACSLRRGGGGDSGSSEEGSSDDQQGDSGEQQVSTHRDSHSLRRSAQVRVPPSHWSYAAAVTSGDVILRSQRAAICLSQRAAVWAFPRGRLWAYPRGRPCGPTLSSSVERFGMQQANPKWTPLPTGCDLWGVRAGKQPQGSHPPYQQGVGRCCTQPT